MPDATLTRALVAHSARERIADLHAVAAVVAAAPTLANLRPRWNEAMRAFDEAGEAWRVEAASSPTMRRWLYETGRAFVRGQPRERQRLLRRVANYTAGAQARPGASIRLEPTGDIVETWDCGVHVAVAPGRAPAKVLELQDLSVTEWPERLPGTGVTIRNDLPSLRVRLDERGVPQRDGFVLPGVDDRDCSYPRGPYPVLHEAAALLAESWPQAYDELRVTLRVVVPRLPPAGWRMEGFTLSCAQGAVWIRVGSLLSTFESLVHEHGHVKLRYLEEALPILEPDQDAACHPVGWRTDPRPLVGLYEGVFVHIHCALALQRALEAGLLPPALREEAAARMRDLHDQAEEALAILRRHARFTVEGAAYLEWAGDALSERIQ